jgi:hypothetical protein
MTYTTEKVKGFELKIGDIIVADIGNYPVVVNDAVMEKIISSHTLISDFNRMVESEANLLKLGT